MASRVFHACSGAANTGLLTDQLSRSLVKAGCGSMTCLAGVGADLVKFKQDRPEIRVVLDGCQLQCGAKILNQKGLEFEHYILTDYGVEKGVTEITPELVGKLTNQFKDQWSTGCEKC